MFSHLTHSASDPGNVVPSHGLRSQDLTSKQPPEGCVTLLNEAPWVLADAAEDAAGTTAKIAALCCIRATAALFLAVTQQTAGSLVADRGWK